MYPQLMFCAKNKKNIKFFLLKILKFYNSGKICILHVQVNLIITLSMGSTESDRVISESCYNEVAYNRHIVK